MSAPARIVIIGGGFAGAYCARKLSALLGAGEARVTLIDRNNYFIFYPLLVEAGTGSLEPRHAVVPLREFAPRADFLMANVKHIDRTARRVTCEVEGRDDDVTLEYDHLVLALGSETMMPPIPGLEENAYELKSLADSIGLRDRAIQLLEQADTTADEAARRALLHFVIVGGSFTGVEVAGEFDVMIKSALRYYPHLAKSDIRITLIERSARILSVLDEDLAAYALEKLRARGIDVRLNTEVAGVAADSIRLKDGEKLAADTLIWCAGIQPPPMLARLGFACTDRGWLHSGRDLRVPGETNVWGIGDCASIPDAHGQHYAATAQIATRMGEHLAHNIARVIRGMAPTECNIENRGVIVPLGCRAGVARLFGIKVSGFAAWWLFRTVYLLKMPTLSRKVRLALDWTVDLLFARDVVQLGLHRRRHSGDS